MEWMDIIISFCVVITLFYYWSTSTFNFWKSRAIAGPPPKPFFGNVFNIFLAKLSLGEYFKTAYDAHPDESMFGVFVGREPVLVLKDLDLISDVMVKHFSAFPSRGSATFNNVEGPLFDHLFNLEAARWRPMRIKLAPIFTSGKLKRMFNLMLECGKNLGDHLEKLTMNDEAVVECYEFLAKYTTDVVGHCFFGLQINTLDDGNHQFRKVSREILLYDWKKFLKLNIREFLPSLFSRIEPFMADGKITDFFMNIMIDTIDYRKKNQIVRHDLIDVITNLRDSPDAHNDIEMTDSLLAAQLALFLMAGFETSANTMSFLLYELATNHTIQDKLRDEIYRESAKNDGEITYESIASMKYLKMVFDETLRLYPQGHLIARQSTKEYTFANTKLTIPAEMRIVIPVFAIHRDPRIYPNPEVFDPERFTDEAIKSRHASSWLGFGDGPRQCIGIRFANYQSKVGVINILKRYKVDVCDKTEIPCVFDPTAFLLAPKNGIHLKISKIA